MMAKAVKTKIIETINNSKYFNIIIDTTSDISHCEQLAIMIRAVYLDFDNESGYPEIKEYFMNFINISSTTRLNLSNVLIKKGVKELKSIILT